MHFILHAPQIIWVILSGLGLILAALIHGKKSENKSRAFRPDAPEGLERVLLKAMQKQPRDRWKSAQAMADALRPYLYPIAVRASESQ